MSAIPPISPAAVGSVPSLAINPATSASAATGSGFASLLVQGLQNMETKVAHADELVKRFVVDDSIPVHQVTYALEEARLSVELAMQVRSRVIEAYRDLMNMQL
jgi:flagellar hook-basal body complex protein FliE